MKKTIPLNRSFLASLCLLSFISGIAHADVATEVVKLLPNDGSTNGQFGISTALNGNIALIGVPSDDTNANNAGAAYLFDATTGVQIAKLLADDSGNGDGFGRSVALSRTIAIVGAYRNSNANGNRAGAVYLFDSRTGVQLAKLIANDGETGDWFGSDVDISGNTAIIGAYQDDDNGISAGSAYLFDTTTGLQIAKLLPDDTDDYDYFGSTVAIYGNRAIVGARGFEYQAYDTGAAYLYDVATAQQITKLLPFNLQTSGHYGTSISMGPSISVVGARSSFSGSSYALILDTQTGAILEGISPASGKKVTSFAKTIGISGRYAIVGASAELNGEQTGTAYVFDTATGAQHEQFFPSDIAAGDGFGSSVTINGTKAIVTSPSDDDNGDQSGSAYVFDIKIPPTLTRDVATISLSEGGVQEFSLNASYDSGKWFFFLLGSASGTEGYPLINGFELPLQLDRYLAVTVSNPNLAIFTNFVGKFDDSGHAIASLNIPPGSEPFLAGVTLHHAYFAGPQLGSVNMVSNAVSVNLVP